MKYNIIPYIVISANCFDNFDQIVDDTRSKKISLTKAEIKPLHSKCYDPANYDVIVDIPSGCCHSRTIIVGHRRCQETKYYMRKPLIDLDIFTLIILINVAALILKDDIKKEENNINQNQISNDIPKTHLEIINYINKRIFNE